MEYLDHPFEVSTGSGRRPTPLTYEHLRDYPALVKQYLRLSSQTDIVNVNDILNLTGNLYVSNEISRVIAQVIGKLDPGFITIEGTEDGALHVYPAGGSEDGKIDVNIADGDSVTLGAIADAIVAAGAAGTISAKLRRATQGLEDLKTLISLAAGTNLIGKVQIQGSSQTILSAAINIATIATHDIIAAVASKSHKICSICFTVAGEVNVTLRDESAPLSGAMDFGASGESMGMTQNHDLAPLPCTVSEKFQITLSHAVQVSGYVTYYDE